MTDPQPDTPTSIDWALLLAVAARRGVRVWRADRHGVLSPVGSVDEVTDR